MDGESEDAPELSVDVRRLDELQKQYDQLVQCVGAEDRIATDLKARLERARASKRGKLSISAQIVTAERRRTKLGKLIENAKKGKEDVEKQRDEIEEQIQRAAKSVTELVLEEAKVGGEVEALHKKALADQEGKTSDANEERRTDAGTAWNTLIEETKARVSYPGARLGLAGEAEQIFTMLQAFLSQLPQQVYTISEDGNTKVGNGEGKAEGADACRGQENEAEEWSEGDYDAI